MPRCPYCDAEYILGEIYCKSCSEDLTSLDLQPVSVAPEPPDPLPLFTPHQPQPEQPAAPPDDGSDRHTPADVPEVPPVPQAPSLSSAIELQVPHALAGEIGMARGPAADAVPTPAVGPVCPSCGMTNEKDSKFCDGCGKPLGGSCPSCQGVNRPGAKFCQHCGHRLGQVAPATASVVLPAGPVSHADRATATKPWMLLLLTKEGRELARYPLREGVNQVGVKSPGEGIFPEVDLSRLDSQQVISRRHAVIRVVGDLVTLADCGSTNGTRVDGTKIATTEVPVDEGSSIVIGNLHARLART